MARDTETIGGGLKIWARFTLFMTLALTAVMVCAGFFLYTTATQVAHAGQERTLVESMALTAEAVGVDAESARLTAEHEVLSELVHDLESGAPESIAAWRESLLRRIDDNVTEHEALEPFWKQVGDTAFTHQGNTTSFAIEYGPEGQTGRLFQYRNPDRPDDPPYRVLQPDSPDRAASALLGLIIGTTIAGDPGRRGGCAVGLERGVATARGARRRRAPHLRRRPEAPHGLGGRGARSRPWRARSTA